MEWVAWVVAATLGGAALAVRGVGYLSERQALATFRAAALEAEPGLASPPQDAPQRSERPPLSRGIRPEPGLASPPQDAPQRSEPAPLSRGIRPEPTSPKAPVDRGLWSVGRIRAYARAVTRASDPPLGVLRIPRLRLEVPVLEGTDGWTLDRGAGHIEGTARPGEAGNVGIAAHRDSHFRALKDIAVGDLIELALPGSVRRYRVEGLSVAHPDDVRPLKPSADARLTLVTCYPFYFVGPAPERFIVRAELMSPPSPRRESPVGRR